MTDLLSDGKTPYERRFGQPFKGPIIPFGSMVEYHPTTAEDQSRIHQFGKKVLPGWFLGYALYAGGIWKGDVLVADLGELETMDASDLLSDGKTPYERRFGIPFNGPVIPFGTMVEYHSISAKNLSRLHQFGAKVLPGLFLGYALYAGEAGKETLWSQTLRNWRRWTHQNSTPEGSMQRKC